jgi:hypothetical protein
MVHLIPYLPMVGVLKVSIDQLKKIQTVKLHAFITNLIRQSKIFFQKSIYMPTKRTQAIISQRMQFPPLILCQNLSGPPIQ